MKLPKFHHLNYAPIAAVLFSALCWLGLYAVYANFGQRGFELLQRPGALFNVEGVFFVGLHAMGLLLLIAFALGALTTLTRSGIRGDAQGHPSEMNRTL